MAIGFKGIKWFTPRSAWKEMEYQRARRAEFSRQENGTLDGINAAMTAAHQNKISTAATLAGNAALKRVQAAVKAKSDENIKQIDQTTKLIDDTQSKAGFATDVKA